VQVNLLGLDLRKSDGTSATLEFNSGELVDLMDLRNGDPLRLFTNEDLPVGSYTGVRLLFDTDEQSTPSRTTTATFRWCWQKVRTPRRFFRRGREEQH